MYVVRKTSTEFSSISKRVNFTKLRLHVHARELGAKTAPQTTSMHMTFYKTHPRKRCTKPQERSLSSHAHSIAECKTFARLNKSKEAEVNFLENIGFLTEKKNRSLKYHDMRIIDTKKTAANEYLQQPLDFYYVTDIGIDDLCVAYHILSRILPSIIHMYMSMDKVLWFVPLNKRDKNLKSSMR